MTGVATSNASLCTLKMRSRHENLEPSNTNGPGIHCLNGCCCAPCDRLHGHGPAHQRQPALTHSSLLAFEGVATAVVPGEGLGIGHQFPTLFTQFVHQTDQRDVPLRMASRDQLPVIQPKLFDFAGPRLATGDKAQLGVFPPHHEKSAERRTI